MTSAVFGHGQLRLYLLATLAERGPMSGYDLMRVLENHFAGLYSPSAGTVYPRLAKLEEEGLVTRTDEGRRSTYAITDAGRTEVEARADEVEGLAEHMSSSSEQLADDLQRRVAEGAGHITSLLGSAAAAARAGAERAEAERGSRERPTDESDEGRETDGTGPGATRPGTGSDAGARSASFESFERLARDLGRAERFRAEHAEEIASLGALARGLREHPWLTGTRGPGAAANAAEDEPVTDDPVTGEPGVIDAEVVGEEPAQSEDAGGREDERQPAGLDRTQVRRIVGILRGAADELEAVLENDVAN